MAQFATLLALAAGPVRGQPCSIDELAEGVLRDSLRADVTGTGDSWEDIVSRIIADIDSLDLDRGETETTLTWNAHPWVSLEGLLVRSPELYKPLREAAQQDQDLLQRLEDGASDADDYEVTLDIHIQGKKDSRLQGLWTATADAVKSSAEVAERAWKKVSASAAGLSSRTPCEQNERFFELVGPTMSDRLSLRLSPASELKAVIAKRFRDDLVGPDEVSAGFKYTYGIDDAGEDEGGTDPSIAQERVDLFKETEGRQLTPREASEALQLVAVAQESGEFVAPREFNDVMKAAAAGGKTFIDEAIGKLKSQDDEIVADRKVSIEANWTERDAFSFGEGLATALFSPEEQSLTAKAAFSLKFKRDGKPVATLPRYELSASYQDVDEDSTRQSRFVARGIVSTRVAVAGQDTEMTIGLVYANKPEFLADEEFDKDLSANVGLAWKFGSTAPLEKR